MLFRIVLRWPSGKINLHQEVVEETGRSGKVQNNLNVNFTRVGNILKMRNEGKLSGMAF